MWFVKTIVEPCDPVMAARCGIGGLRAWPSPQTSASSRGAMARNLSPGRCAIGSRPSEPGRRSSSQGHAEETRAEKASPQGSATRCSLANRSTVYAKRKTRSRNGASTITLSGRTMLWDIACFRRKVAIQWTMVSHCTNNQTGSRDAGGPLEHNEKVTVMQ